MQLAVWLLFICFGSVISFIDWKNFRIPNRLLVGLLIGIVTVLVIADLAGATTSWMEIFAVSTSWLVGMGIISSFSRGGFGMGDAKYIAVIAVGATASHVPTSLIVWLAAVLASIVFGCTRLVRSRPNNEGIGKCVSHVPFGPYLTLSTLACFAFALNG